MFDLKYFGVVCTTLYCFSNAAMSLPAFPGAEGFGTETPGGRGGNIIEVTNLNDSGPGSFRQALLTKGPRIVVFKVAGTIAVKSKISITQPFLTIAGQTAPGGGITIKNDPSYGGMPINIDTHDVVVRYLRVRPGPPSSSALDGGNLDAMDLSSYNIVVDHCSFSWGTDENVTFGGARDSTFQWNIVAEGLGNSTNPKGFHSKGLHLREGNSDHLSIHHNILAHNYDRNPNINTDGVVDFVNNIVYNASRWTEVKDKFGEPNVNIVNNFYKLGPDSKSSGYEVFYYENQGLKPKVFVKGNIGPHRPSDDLAQDLIVRSDSRWMIVNSAFTAPPITTFSAHQAYDLALDNAGANKPKRDSHDARIVNDVRNKTGHIIDSPQEVGGWQVMQPGVVSVDNDHDGMPDSWETQYGLNPFFGADGAQDLDGDGYTNVEEHLNNTNPTVAELESSAPPEPINPPEIPQGPGDTLVFTPVDDASIHAGNPTANFGASKYLDVDKSALENLLLKFSVYGIGADEIISAKLRLYNKNSSDTGGDLYRVLNNSWSESNVNWNNAPVAEATKFASVGAVTSGNWYEIDVKSWITGDGTYSLRMQSTSTNGAGYSSKEVLGYEPQLVITTQK